MSHYAVLRELGLSKTAVACYESLFEDGAATVAQLAKRLLQSRTGLYRVLRQMEQQGFVTSFKTSSQPTYFDVELVNKALKRYADYQHHIVAELITEQADILARRSGKTVSQ